MTLAVLSGSMSNDGGFVLAQRDDGRRVLRCPVQPCTFEVVLTDLGELVDCGVSEDQLRRHFDTHTPAAYLRTIAALRAEIDRRPMRCCAVQAISEVADALQREMGDATPDDAWTARQAGEHLAAAERDHHEH